MPALGQNKYFRTGGNPRYTRSQAEQFCKDGGGQLPEDTEELSLEVRQHGSHHFWLNGHCGWKTIQGGAFSILHVY